ncbi:MAG: DUF4065 domain-containing protein [Deltaproteobacteria bacterium]|nr:DUF4065 domain-containing protein [Deltaproteobacteria bacterium]
MYRVLDVAAFILRERAGWTDTLALQKLVYYAQAWSLVWDGRPLFREPVEAWIHGPVVRALWDLHRERPQVSAIPGGQPEALDETAAATVRAVLGFYGKRHAGWLVDLSHREEPWRKARGSLPPDVPGDAEIDHASMRAYYGSAGLKKGVFTKAYARGLKLLASTPLYDLPAFLDETTRDAEGLEEWLETGAGDPWAPS